MSSLFGLDPSNRLMFVSEVPRGLACQCRCVVCDEPLVARQGAVREHHFAHTSGREPCAVSHESLLHRYAKQVIEESGGLTVPMDSTVAQHLGLDATPDPTMYLELPRMEVERSLQDVRPDLTGYLVSGVTVAIEVAYSSFCDRVKVEQFSQLGLPALEINLRAFTPQGFEAEAVREAVVHQPEGKAWLWPTPPAMPTKSAAAPALRDLGAVVDLPRSRLPETIVTISGRWVSIKEFPSGDLAIRSVKYDPDITSLVKTIAKANHAHYSPKWKSWNVPRWRAEAVRAALHEAAQRVSIVVRDRSGDSATPSAPG